MNLNNKIIQLKTQTEAKQKEAARAEAEFEASKRNLDKVRQEILDLGFADELELEIKIKQYSQEIVDQINLIESKLQVLE